MSFFKELKEDLAQAVDELLPEETAADDTFEDSRMVNTLDEPDDEDVYNLTEEAEADSLEQEMLVSLYQEEEKEAAAEAKQEQPKIQGEAKTDVTVITKGTTINGSIISDGSLEIMGTIVGDVECLGKLTIVGDVRGNSSAAEVYVNTKKLDGSIMSEGSVKIGVGTVVIGDITATSSVIAGAVKGQIDVNGPVIIDSTAVIKGNINAKAVQINNGAVMEGFCSLSYSTVDIDTFFDAEENA